MAGGDAPVALLTGGSGFVGQHLAPALRAALPQHRHVLLTRGDRAALPGWDVVEADLLDSPSIDAAIAMLRPAIVVHLAAQSSVGAAASAAEVTWRVNFGGSFALATAIARHAPGGLFLFASSAEVYGRSFVAGPATESTPPQPQNAYAASKLAAEHALAQVLPLTTRLIVARAFNHTGPGQDERFALPSFAAQIARIEQGLWPPEVRVGDLSAVREMLHVADVVAAYVGLLALPTTAPRVVVNVASGTGHRIGDLLDRLRGLARVPVRMVTDPARLRAVDIPRTVGDPALLARLTGWAPTRDIGTVLEETLGWWRDRVAAGGPG